MRWRQYTPAMPIPMGYELQPSSSNLNANNSKKKKDREWPFTKYNPTTKFTACDVHGSPMPMDYEQFKPPQNNVNAPNYGRIQIESEDFPIYDVPGDGQCYFHAHSLAITGNVS